ncbi:MAG TPA: hypothetical protein VFM77_09505 [Terriglobales bacterium]|nr:hypothetical protein [Terriglobales bacterium]
MQGIFEKLKKVFCRREPEQPQDPYAYVTAPRKPRPSSRSAAAVADLED